MPKPRRSDPSGVHPPLQHPRAGGSGRGAAIPARGRQVCFYAAINVLSPSRLLGVLASPVLSTSELARAIEMWPVLTPAMSTPLVLQHPRGGGSGRGAAGPARGRQVCFYAAINVLSPSRLLGVLASPV
jgi:hypothetical protein